MNGNRKAPQRSKASESRYSITEFMRDFPNDEACLQWLWKTRYEVDGEGRAICPNCGELREFKRYQTMQQRQSWTCTGCGHHVHPTAGTIFHKSSTSLQLWFYGMYLMTSTRCGISAKQLERELGVTYKTAWRMFNLIRNELMTPTDEQFCGSVEMDETYVGGRPRLGEVKNGKAGIREWMDDNKVPVFGMVERQGKVAAHVVPSTQRVTLMSHVSRRVVEGATVYTDDAKVYQGLARDGFNHLSIDHSSKVYVSGDIHTQTIEGFWSIVKRGISGTYHAVSPKWLQGYLNEYAWRYNNREDGRGMFLLLILRAALR